LKEIRGARILLAEDNEINQQVAKEILEQAALMVEVANNGKEAVEMAEKNLYDAILMDIQMPEMGGFEATGKIRNFESDKKNIPIIAMTAHAMAGDREKSLAAGMNDHVTKPIDPDQLFSALVEWIEPGEREVPDYLTQRPPEIDQDLEQLPILEGFDTESGIKRMGGNVAAYKKLLIKFVSNQGDADQKILAAMENQNMDEAVRLSHTLKGVAGNIGATVLHRSAQKLEAVLSGDSSGEPKELWADTKECLLKTLDTLKPFLTIDEPTSEISDTETLSDDMDTDTLILSLQELKEMLEQFNGDAEQVLSEILEKIKGTKLSLPFDAIQKHLSNYDFESALTELESVSERFDIALYGGPK